MSRINRIIVDGEDYELNNKVDKVFFAGDSFDRGMDYEIPAMECGVNDVRFNTSPKSIYINNQSLDDYVTAAASTISSSADCYLDSRLSTLESKVDNWNDVSAQGTSAISYCNSKITTATSTIDELRIALENMADKFEKLTKVEKKKMAGYTPAWYKCKLDLKTRRKNEFEIERLLTI